VELRHLRSFVVAVDESNLSRAAERLHVTQPTLSRQIAALERDLDAQLFSRTGRRLSLTAAGELVLERAHALLDQADHLARDAGRAQRGELGTVRLGFAQSATFQALPAIVRAFRDVRPDVHLDTRAMPSLWQLDALRAGRLDVGLLRLPDTDTGLATRIVSRDHLVAALPARHPLARRERVPLAALADDDFVFYAHPERPDAQDAVVPGTLGYCRDAGFTPRIVHEGRDVQTIASLVAAGLGVSLLVSPTPPDHGGAIVYRRLQDELPGWELALAWSRDEPAPALAAFIEAASRVTPLSDA
jgi:DNA-binding transcriptional LysR family regulator